MTRRTCTETRCIRPAEQGTNTGLCELHNWEAMLENDHIDGNHDFDPDCPVCNETETPAPRPEPTRKNTSHADCDHPKTKAARAACRRERKLPSAPAGTDFIEAWNAQADQKIAAAMNTRMVDCNAPDEGRCLDCNHIHPDRRCPACGCSYFGDRASTTAPGDYRPSIGARRTRR